MLCEMKKNYNLESFSPRMQEMKCCLVDRVRRNNTESKVALQNLEMQKKFEILALVAESKRYALNNKNAGLYKSLIIIFLWTYYFYWKITESEMLFLVNSEEILKLLRFVWISVIQKVVLSHYTVVKILHFSNQIPKNAKNKKPTTSLCCTRFSLKIKLKQIGCLNKSCCWVSFCNISISLSSLWFKDKERHFIFCRLFALHAGNSQGRRTYTAFRRQEPFFCFLHLTNFANTP